MGSGTGPFSWRLGWLAWSREQFTSITGRQHRWINVFGRLWIAAPRRFS